MEEKEEALEEKGKEKIIKERKRRPRKRFTPIPSSNI
jgi:hypothetical protein